MTVAEEFATTESRAAEAGSDFLIGFEQRWLWMALAWQDIKLRYRGSVLGPFWLTASTAVMVVAMGVIYARLFKMEVAHYLPYLTCGLIIWQFISTIINEGCNTFMSVQSIILQVPLPFSIHAFRTVWRNFLVMAHTVIILPPVFLYFQVPIDWNILLVIPALLVLFINGIWVSILFGTISARFRDVPPIVASFVQVIFFVTPIFWSADTLGRSKTILELNPLFAAVDIVRAPLLGTPFAPYSWPLMAVVTVVCSAATFLFFARFRSRIAFWV